MFLNAVPLLQASVRPPSKLRTDPNPRYNCHGLTFASRRTCVLDENEISRILQEDGYEPVGREAVLPGDIAVYYSNNGSSIDHSGIVVSAPEGPGGVPMICSKW